jgi:hypothetical protein
MIVCSTSVRSAGCTFLDWSMHFLTGQTEFYSTRRGWIPLNTNPVNKINAHGHDKNHPSGLTETQKSLTMLQGHNKLSSLYPVAIHMDTAAKNLNIDIDTASPDEWQLIFKHIETDYNHMLRACYEHSAKLIFVSLSNHLPIYVNTVRSLDRMPLSKRPARSVDDYQNSLDHAFFKDSMLAWENNGLTDIWDVRERCALKKNLLAWKQPDLDLNFDHYWVDAQNLWYNGEREIQKIIKWLGLDIQPDRFVSWQPVYKEWQKIQLDVLQFQFNYQHIVESIINNWSYPIDLTFDQEIIIQHCLIYQHGLNLKTWQLKKFPNNTQDLHKLLEPNIHPVPDIYSRLTT